MMREESFQPGSAVNKAHYESQEVVDLLDKAVAETDETKRKEYYKEIQENVYEHVPYIPLLFCRRLHWCKEGNWRN